MYMLLCIRLKSSGKDIVMRHDAAVKKTNWLIGMIAHLDSSPVYSVLGPTSLCRLATSCISSCDGGD